jgi:hypothetical protein
MNRSSEYYRKESAREHEQLQNYSRRRRKEITKIYADQIDVIKNYEKLLCRYTLMLGETEPTGLLDRTFRDIMCDIFDTLFVARDLIVSGYASVAFPVLRRAFEAISLLHYFMLDTKQANAWDSGKEFNNVDARKYLQNDPLGESSDSLKQEYKYYTSGSHINREYVPTRYLGEGNQFTLGAIGKPDPLVVSEYFGRLLSLWFWFMALVSYQYREVVKERDPGSVPVYFTIAQRAQDTAQSLRDAISEYSERENIAKPKSSS